MSSGYVVVVGAATIDIKASTQEPLRWDAPNLGHVRNSIGGGARNIAENLARLDVETVLLTAIGKDGPGRRVLRHCKENGIKCAHLRLVVGGRTGGNVTLLREDGEPMLSISDYDIMNYVDADYLRHHTRLFARADLIVIDATLSDEALAMVFELAARYRVRVCADPTSPNLAARLCPYLTQLYMVAPNAAETIALCGVTDPAKDRESALDAARSLVAMGTQLAVVTLGEQGVAYADASGSGFIRASRTHVIDSTGAGDAFSAAVIFGLLNHVDVDEAMRLGMTAASLTLQSYETVVPGLTQELLYDKLVV